MRIASLLPAVLFVPLVACAQSYPASQRGTVSQHVAFTEISIVYGRPVARGRELWGKLVPWDAVWHPGADSATRVTFSKDVKVEGKELKAGEYSLWLIPRNGKPWTVIFNRTANTWHRNYPGESNDALRVDVTPDTLSHMESMMIYFPSVNGEEATMRIHWGTLGVAVHIVAPER
jgi:hypothetical protein